MKKQENKNNTKETEICPHLFDESKRLDLGHIFKCNLIPKTKYRSCVAAPMVFESVGHCTGTAYGTIWMGDGEYNPEIAKSCPGYCLKKGTPEAGSFIKKDYQKYFDKVDKKWTEKLKNHYKEKGIERSVL